MTRLSYTEIRRDLAETLNRVSYQGGRVVVQRRGKDVAALVPIEDLELLERLEDRLDAQLADEAMGDDEGRETLPWSEVRRELLDG